MMRRTHGGWAGGVGCGLGLLVTLALVGSACISATPQRLEEQVAFFHDDLRWGRMPAAEQTVVASRRLDFVRQHAAWGRAIQIVDMESEGARIQGFTGVVMTRYMWTRGADTVIRETTVESRWHGAPGGSWVLTDERVVSGDPALLATAAPLRPLRDIER